MKSAFMWSLLAHLSLILVLLVPHCNPKISYKDDSSINIQLFDEPQATPGPTPQASPEQEKRDIVEAGGEGPECERWYGGIGIYHNGNNNTIERVIEGYPAYRAGLREGDRILSDNDSIIGEPGTQLILYIERDGETIEFVLTREKICVEG